VGLLYMLALCLIIAFSWHFAHKNHVTFWSIIMYLSPVSGFLQS